MGLIKWILDSDNRRNLRKLEAIAQKVEALEDKYKAMSEEELKGMTAVLKKRLNENYETLDDILPDAFATIREASWRVLGMRHYHVQIIGGIALHEGRIAEMRTGEGKTLVSTLPAYLNALSGKGVHIVTVNDYLAQRDAEWMGKVHKYLGLTVGITLNSMSNDEKRAAYACDITYGTNNEFGFDYLRDNMVIYKKDMVQRELNFAVIDEVDSILIDEARTPLIISGKGSKSSEMYVTANTFARGLKADDYEIEEKKKAINLSESGIRKAEKFFNIDNLSDVEHTELNHYINNAIRANYIMKRDVDYIVNDGEIVIVDEFTGRLMIGRRYSEGLHQAIEAKEKVRIQSENKTMATITFQNYFRLYNKLGGMTGTAKTEEKEFKDIYSLDVVTIPTNKPIQRIDEQDQIYSTREGKLRAVVNDIVEAYHKGQPVLVGTTNVEKSEELSIRLRRARIPHNVLNAKNHAKEADIVAQAGKKNAVTIATNMAGRGTDILLGGNAEYLALKKMREMGKTEEEISAANAYFSTDDEKILADRKLFADLIAQYKKQTDKEKEEVIAVGGLRIIGTERHESRRIDNQLRGRAGRQGDVGRTVFYLSMEDELVRLFGGDRMKAIAQAFKIDEDTPFAMGMLTHQIENAQKNLEGRNYSIRKQVLEYDNVMNTQRTIIYNERNTVLKGESVHEQIVEMIKGEASRIVEDYTDPRLDWDDWDIENLNKEVNRRLLPSTPEFLTQDDAQKLLVEEIEDKLITEALQEYNAKIDSAKEMGADFEEIERVVLLRVVDNKWMDHIDQMDVLRRGIGLKAYGNEDPVIAYKREGFEMFDDMIASIHHETVALLMHVNIEKAPAREPAKPVQMVAVGSNGPEKPAPVQSKREPGRNDLCPCGSGKKYKACCGANK